jgi:alpha-tubulin suppressor-like RCC1 family protein
MKKLTLTMTFIVFLFTATLAQSNAILNKTIQVSNGAHHSLILKEDGTVWAFGSNAYGQLCDGTTTNRNRPVQVSGLSDIIMVAAGGGQSFALREDGTVWACGGNSSGELGDGTITHRSRPVKSKLSDIIKIAAGGAHGLALKDDGTVLSWGYNKFGQLGIGSTTKSINPVQVPGVSNITDIVAENCHSLALRNDGIVIGWGLNGPGQLGDGTSRDQRSPIQIPGISNITLMEAGTNFSLFLKDDGTVWGAGGSNYPDYIIQLTELSNISYLTTKYSHIIAQKNDGTMWAWGPNNTGQLGDGTTIDQDSPIHVPELEQFTTIDAGYCSNLALKEDGAVWSWGCNGTGQLGYADASILPKPIPSDIQFSAKSYTATQNTSLTVTIISTAQKDIAVSYTTVDGTAIAGIDYVYTSGSLSFLAAETQKVITLTILNNPANYTNKTFGLSLGVPSNVFLNDASEVSITISGNQQPDRYQFTSRIPDTGQTKCYDNEKEIPCPKPGEDFYGQDANYNINPQSFTKLDAQGNDLPDSATEWTMVRDNVTGLIWEVKTDDGSIHDKDNTYTWYDSNPETNGGFAGTDGDGTDTEDFIKELNDSNYGGFSDWRLPTSLELVHIFNADNHNPAIDQTFFPNTMPSPYYWSSTSFIKDKPIAWAVYFAYGNVIKFGKDSFNYVRAVRGGQLRKLEASASLVHNNDGTVTDIATGLMWQKESVNQDMNWQVALNYCEKLTTSNYTDWRLPNINELTSILDYSKYNPAIDNNFFYDNLSETFWSSSPYSGLINYAWMVNFYYGHKSSSNKLSSNYVRSVRGGQHQSIENLYIFSPEQSAIFHPGEKMSIKWNPKNISEDVNILISREGGKTDTFIPIANGIPNNGEYEWTVTQPPSVNCMLRIEPTNEPDKGSTQGLFTIINAIPDDNKIEIIYNTDNSIPESALPDTTVAHLISNGESLALTDSQFTLELLYANNWKLKTSSTFNLNYDAPTADSYYYTITIVKETASESIALKIREEPNNSPPVAHGSNTFLDEDKYIYINLIAADSDNDTITYHILTNPEHGSITLTDDTVLYRPHPHYNGPDSFTFKASDNISDSNTAKIMITIYPVYDTPQADLRHVTTTENMPVNITLTGFSPDNKPLTYHITNPPAHGSLSQSLPYLTYTPDYHFYGTDEFTYIANDGISNSVPASVSITVARSNTYGLKLLGNGYGTVNVNSTVVLLPWESQFLPDQEICFEAIPETDWKFIHWQGDLQTTENPVCIVLDQNKTITANMEIKTFVLSIDGSEPITINNALHTLPFSKVYEIHSPITLESTSEFFNCWESDLQIFDNPYTFSINSDMAITASFFPVPDWQSDIHVERLVNTSDVVTHDSVIIGAASQAYSKSASDPPDNYSCHIVLNNQSFDAMEKEIKKDNHSEYQWIIAVDPHGNADSSYVQTTATISWNPDTFSSEGHFLLKSMTNEILVPDMRQTTEFQFTDNSYVLFKIIWQRLETFDFHLQQGWNLISLPMTPSNTALSHMFPDYEAAYAYQNGAYYPVTNILPGKGYWLKIPSQKIYSISGQPFPSYTIDFSNGWHLIGGAYNEMSPDDESIKVIFQYVNGVYKQAFTLLPGFGYWIKIEE